MGDTIDADKSHLTTESVLFDAVVLPGGDDFVDALREQGGAKQFVAEAFKQTKPIAALDDGIDLLETVSLPGVELSTDGTVSEHEVVTSRTADDLDGFLDSFVAAIAAHRHWDQEEQSVPV